MMVKKFELKVWPMEGEAFTIDGEGDIAMNLLQEMPVKELYERGRISPKELAYTGDMIVQMDARWVHKGLLKKFWDFIAQGLFEQ